MTQERDPGKRSADVLCTTLDVDNSSKHAFPVENYTDVSIELVDSTGNTGLEGPQGRL